MTAQVELRSGAAHATLAPAIGGAISGFWWHDIPVLRPMTDAALADANVRLASAFPLVPYSNRIRDALLVAGGCHYRLQRNFGDARCSIHGVGWQRAWSVEDADATGARLALTYNADGHDDRDARTPWPWPFHATQTFALQAGDDAATLAVTMTLRNRGDRPFPFGLGWHPFFPKSATTTLQFAADGVWVNDAMQLPLERTAIPPQWDFGSQRAIAATTLDNVFTQWRGKATLETAQTGRRTTIEADPACAFLVVYSPPGSDFVALEPVSHETDAFNRSAQGEADTGTRWLPPGAAFSCTMRINATQLHAT